MMIENKKSPITNNDMFYTIKKMLETKYEEYASAASILDYAIPCHNEVPLKSETWFPEIIANVSPGSNEGIYIDWLLQFEDEKIRIGTLKTLEESIDGYIAMGKISGMLIWASDQYLVTNDKKIAGK